MLEASLADTPPGSPELSRSQRPTKRRVREDSDDCFYSSITPPKLVRRGVRLVASPQQGILSSDSEESFKFVMDIEPTPDLAGIVKSSESISPNQPKKVRWADEDDAATPIKETLEFDQLSQGSGTTDETYFSALDPGEEEMDEDSGDDHSGSADLFDLETNLRGEDGINMEPYDEDDVDAPIKIEIDQDSSDECQLVIAEDEEADPATAEFSSTKGSGKRSRLRPVMNAGYIKKMGLIQSKSDATKDILRRLNDLKREHVERVEDEIKLEPLDDNEILDRELEMLRAATKHRKRTPSNPPKTIEERTQDMIKLVTSEMNKRSLNTPTIFSRFLTIPTFSGTGDLIEEQAKEMTPMKEDNHTIETHIETMPENFNDLFASGRELSPMTALQAIELFDDEESIKAEEVEIHEKKNDEEKEVVVLIPKSEGIRWKRSPRQKKKEAMEKIVRPIKAPKKKREDINSKLSAKKGKEPTMPKALKKELNGESKNVLDDGAGDGDEVGIKEEPLDEDNVSVELNGWGEQSEAFAGDMKFIQLPIENEENDDELKVVAIKRKRGRPRKNQQPAIPNNRAASRRATRALLTNNDETRRSSRERPSAAALSVKDVGDEMKESEDEEWPPAKKTKHTLPKREENPEESSVWSAKLRRTVRTRRDVKGSRLPADDSDDEDAAAARAKKKEIQRRKTTGSYVSNSCFNESEYNSWCTSEPESESDRINLSDEDEFLNPPPRLSWRNDEEALLRGPGTFGPDNYDPDEKMRKWMREMHKMGRIVAVEKRGLRRRLGSEPNDFRDSTIRRFSAKAIHGIPSSATRTSWPAAFMPGTGVRIPKYECLMWQQEFKGLVRIRTREALVKKDISEQIDEWSGSKRKVFTDKEVRDNIDQLIRSKLKTKNGKPRPSWTPLENPISVFDLPEKSTRTFHTNEDGKLVCYAVGQNVDGSTGYFEVPFTVPFIGLQTRGRAEPKPDTDLAVAVPGPLLQLRDLCKEAADTDDCAVLESPYEGMADDGIWQPAWNAMGEDIAVEEDPFGGEPLLEEDRVVRDAASMASGAEDMNEEPPVTTPHYDSYHYDPFVTEDPAETVVGEAISFLADCF